MNYYNENDPQAAAWLRELVIDGEIPDGEIDTRDIRDISPGDLRGFSQCHFFAGVGGWAYALRLARWPEGRPVWTGSCPCQPFSVAGQGRGTSDDRHLWPAFRWLIAQCRPKCVFGEQVASKAAVEWITGVHLDLEALGYKVGVADIPAAGVGAPNIRQRLWWVGHTQVLRDSELCEPPKRTDSPRTVRTVVFDKSSRVLHRESESRLADMHGNGCEQRRQDLTQGWHDGPIGGGAADWSRSIWHPCRDGKSRRIPIEPALFPLADGLPGRVGLLRGAGNAINPWVAKTFIEEVCGVIDD